MFFGNSKKFWPRKGKRDSVRVGWRWPIVRASTAEAKPLVSSTLIVPLSLVSSLRIVARRTAPKLIRSRVKASVTPRIIVKALDPEHFH